MKKTNKTNCEADFPQEAIDAWAAVYIDVADKLSQQDESNGNACPLPMGDELLKKPNSERGEFEAQ